jgi:16S rRNA (guanine966-N2)-methyltransferase
LTRRRQQLRIIGGRWRSRRLYFDPIEGLRPTPDRVRETLFNWLSPIIAGARCLDLFAGSGALGIEALSRGAAAVVFVERQPRAVRRLRENLALLGDTAAQIECADALSWLQGRASAADAFDIVFLDPPFGQGLLEPACAALAQHGWLRPAACVYLEMERTLQPQLPAGWQIARAQTAGQISYCLAVT